MIDESKKYTVIIKRPDEEYGHRCSISFRLENLQKTVGEYIEEVDCLVDGYPHFMVICNEEGKIQNLPFNMNFPGDNFVGTIIVVGSTIDGELAECPLTFKQWKELVDTWRK